MQTILLFAIIFGIFSVLKGAIITRSAVKRKGSELREESNDISSESCASLVGLDQAQVSPTDISAFPYSPVTVNAGGTVKESISMSTAFGLDIDIDFELKELEDGDFSDDVAAVVHSSTFHALSRNEQITEEDFIALDDFGNIPFHPLDSISDGYLFNSPGVTDTDARILLLTSFSKYFIDVSGVAVSDQIDRTIIGNVYKIDQNWPSFATDPKPQQSQMSLRFKKATLLSIIDPNLPKYYTFLEKNIFDTSRPILILGKNHDNNENNFVTWFHLILKQKIIDQDALNVALKALPVETLNRPDSNGVLPLHLAIFRGDFGTLQKLLDHGADCNRITSFRFNPFLYSVYLKSNGIYKQLLDSGKADPNAVSTCGQYSFMHYVVKFTDISILLDILNSFIPLKPNFMKEELAKISEDESELISNMICSIWIHLKSSEALKSSLVHFVIETDNLAVLKLLHHHPVGLPLSIPICNADGRVFFLIHLATYYNATNCLEYLILNGIDPDTIALDGCTALFFSTDNANQNQNQIESTRILLKYGAHLDLSNVFVKSIKSDNFILFREICSAPQFDIKLDKFLINQQHVSDYLLENKKLDFYQHIFGRSASVPVEVEVKVELEV